MPEWFGTDVRHSLLHNFREGRLGLLGSSRFYVHYYDRTLAPREYALGMNWGDEVDLSTLHRGVPLLKQLVAAPKRRAAAPTRNNKPKLSPKKKQARARPISTDAVDSEVSGRGRGRGGRGRGGRQGRGDGRYARGAQPWHNDTVQLFGNAVNLFDFSAVHIGLVLTMTEEAQDRKSTRLNSSHT